MRKLLMNCDQVFDVLTRGPFPTGDESDEAVERHLRACHECRQLAEALQPAVELLHESLAAEHAADLPEYQGVLAVVERSVATADRAPRTPLVVRQLARPPIAQRRPWTLAGLAQAAVALVMLAAIGSLVWNVISTAKHPAGHSDLLVSVLTPQGAARPVRLEEQGLLTLASLNLPAQCFPRDVLKDAGGSGAAPGPIDQEALQCCTECHHAGQAARPSRRTVAAMQLSCLACHSQ